MNGFIVEQGRRVGRRAPANEALVELVHQVECGAMVPSPALLADL